MSTLQNRLKELRVKNKLTQDYVADKLGITKSTLSKYENGHRSPGREICNSYANLFEVSVDYLLGRTNDPDVRLIDKEEISKFTSDKKLEQIALSNRIRTDEELAEKVMQILKLIESTEK